MLQTTAGRTLRSSAFLEALRRILPDMTYTQALVTFATETLGSDGILEILRSAGIGEPTPEDTEP